VDEFLHKKTPTNDVVFVCFNWNQLKVQSGFGRENKKKQNRREERVRNVFFVFVMTCQMRKKRREG